MPPKIKVSCHHIERDFLYFRAGAAKFLRDRGFQISENTIAAFDGLNAGPRYRVVGGRAVYCSLDLLAWAQNLVDRGRLKSTDTPADDAGATLSVLRP